MVEKEENNSNSKIQSFKKQKGNEYISDQKKRKFDKSGDHGNSHKKAKGDVVSKTDPMTYKTKGEKTDWRLMKAETKTRKDKRNTHKFGGKDNYDAFNQSVKLWEESRSALCLKPRRVELVAKIAKLFKGNVVAWMKKKKSERIISHIITSGTPEIRQQVFKEINNKSTILDLTKDSHDFHIIMKLIKFGDKDIKNQIYDCYTGEIMKLCRHTIASKVIDLAYTEYTTAKQRSVMLQEFFGPNFRYFKEEDVDTLADALRKYPDRKKEVLAALQVSLRLMLHKDLLECAIVHAILREYLQFCSDEERQEVIVSVSEGLIRMAHTKEGAHVGRLCLWHATAKQRKTILKTFKEHILKMATWDHSYTVLMAALDCVDDTKLLGKALLEPLMKEAVPDKLFSTDHGVKLFRYMVLGRHKSFFSPTVVKSLEEGDGNPYSKKDPHTRRQEILNAITPALVEKIKLYISPWSSNKQYTLFLVSALETITDKAARRQALKVLAKHAGDTPDMLENPFSHKVLTLCCRKDKQNKIDGKTLFSLLLIKYASKNIGSWLSCNRGCFLSLTMLETEIGRVCQPVSKIVAENRAAVESIHSSSVGAKKLLENLYKFSKVAETEGEESSDDESSSDEEESSSSEEEEVEEKKVEHGKTKVKGSVQKKIEANESSDEEDDVQTATDEKMEATGDGEESSGDEEDSEEEEEYSDDDQIKPLISNDKKKSVQDEEESTDEDSSDDE